MGTSVFIRTIQILSLSYLHSLKLSHWGTPLFCLTLLLPNCSRQYLGWKACPGCQSFQEWESLLCYLKISLFLRENRPNIHNLASSTSPMLLQAPLHSLNNLKVRKLFTASSFLFPFIIFIFNILALCSKEHCKDAWANTDRSWAPKNQCTCVWWWNSLDHNQHHT